MRAKTLRVLPVLFLLLGTLCRAQNGALQFANLGACKLVSGRQIENCRLAYRTWGTINHQRTNAILFPTWFSGNSSNIAQFIGADKMLDPSKYFIVAIDALGDGNSSSPSNSTTQHGPAFPAFNTHDMVNAEYRFATETLHLTHAHAIMGISMGGMQTFEWIVDYPSFMDLAIPIVGSTRLTSYDLLLWHSEADAIRQDPEWRGGMYTTPPPVGEAKEIHEMNVTTPAWYARNHPPGKFDAAHAEYESKGILPFDANDWLAQLDAMIHHDIAHGGSLEDTAKKVKAKVLVIVAAQDHMVNPKPALDFALLIGARTIILESDCGHRATGCDADKYYPAVRDFLDGK